MPVGARAAMEDGTGDFLGLPEVLASSARHYPGVLEAQAKVRAAEGGIRAAEGAFDLVFGVESRARTSGYYDGRALEATAKQPLGAFGGTLYGSYALSGGDFPLYEDAFYTNTGGRLKVGVLFSLLRDRTIDPRRFGVRDASLAAEAAALDLLFTRVGVQRQAVGAYQGWVATGHQRQVYAELLRLAEDRTEGLERQVQSGARARIQLIENQQNITRRQALLAAAERDFAKAANRLSMFLRRQDGTPVVPAATRLPVLPTLPAIDEVMALPGVDAMVIARRPELRRLRNAIERAQLKVSLDRNALSPRLDLRMEAGEPFGAIGQGGASRNRTETGAGITFTVPLQRRQARGALDRSRADLERLAQQERLVQDELEMEVANLLLELRASRDLAELAAREVEQARALMQAEERRFERGASDFFLVNVREETATNARIRHLQADLAYQLARAEYDAATMNLTRLGLAPEEGGEGLTPLIRAADAPRQATTGSETGGR
ncbi:MAG: TolC family protein [Pseudomonadales bacterium]|nr:TolC family protein [Pseudomonadales bacterium]MCP5185697.1 TolC family protein [Pseudomonadales bacterium]